MSFAGDARAYAKGAVNPATARACPDGSCQGEAPMFANTRSDFFDVDFSFMLFELILTPILCQKF